MARVGDLQGAVFKQKQVADKENRPKWQFWQEKQRLALFCSLLRYVWTSNEAQRAEFSVAGLSHGGRLSPKPACEAAQSASISRRGLWPWRLATPLLAALLAVALVPGSSFHSLD